METRVCCNQRVSSPENTVYSLKYFRMIYLLQLTFPCGLELIRIEYNARIPQACHHFLMCSLFSHSGVCNITFCK